MYKFGTIVLVPFPFTDLTSSKLSPALIVSRTVQKNEDIIVIFITTKIRAKRNPAHFLLDVSQMHFKLTGLKTSSIFHCDKIATLDKRLILGELGVLHPELIKKVKQSFLSAFGF